MNFDQAFMVIWILGVVLELWLFFLCRQTESYIEVHVYVSFCLVRAVVCGGLIPHCAAYSIVWAGLRYMAMPLRGMIAYGAWRSRRDAAWRDIMLGFIVGTGGESACGLLASYLRLACNSPAMNAINLVERLFFCAMIGLWIDALVKDKKARAGDRLFPRYYA